jgi:hypothetical protein
MEKEIINRVANSTLITFDLEEYYQPGERILVDIKDQLFQGLILKEKEFRAFIKEHNWGQYHNRLVAVTCTIDAIIPTWAYMLVAIALKPYAAAIEFGTLQQLEEKLYNSTLSKINWEQFRNAKVVIKGCSKIAVPTSAYVTAAAHLQPIVSSLMFGEACSTVPLFKNLAT